jgi:ribosomal protein S18 acetylase RimI-like enzyme
MDVAIACAGLEDAPLIAGILLAAFREFRPLYTEAAFAATTLGVDAIRCRMREGPVWIATVADHAVGTLAAVARGPALYVRSMAVAPQARRQGIAERLLEHVERYASERRFAALTLSTTPFLDAAIALYERFGFTRTGCDDLCGTPLITMEKRL